MPWIARKDAEHDLTERRDIAADDDAGEARYLWDLSYRFQPCDATVEPGNPAVCAELP